MLATAPADSAETFTVSQRTARSMIPWGWRAVARPSTRAPCSFALNRAMGTNSTKPLSVLFREEASYSCTDYCILYYGLTEQYTVQQYGRHKILRP